MNSSSEKVLAFKTCCSLPAYDQNLEIHLVNRGARPVTVQSHFDQEGVFGSMRVETLFPSGPMDIKPGETKAFYCTMDEERFKKTRRLIFYDDEGNRYFCTDFT